MFDVELIFECYARRHQVPFFLFFGMTRPWIEPPVSRTIGENFTALLDLLFSNPPIPVSIFRWPYRAHYIQLVSLLLSCFIAFQFSSSDWPSQLGHKSTPTASLLRGKTPPTSVLYMTLNNLMITGAWGNAENPFIAIVHSGPES